MRGRSLTFFLFLSPLAILAGGGGQEGNAPPAVPRKLPVPDERARARAEKAMRISLREEYERVARQPEAKRLLELAQRLLYEANNKRDDPAAGYVFFEESARLAARGGDAPGVLRAVDEIDRRYEVDAFRLKESFILETGKNALGKEAQKSLARSALDVMEQAIAAERYAVAGKLSQLAGAAARGGESEKLTRRAEFHRLQLRYLETSHASMRRAAKALLEAPLAPEHNLVVARYQAVARGDVAGALPRLAHCGDPLLAAAAARDLARPADPAGLLLLGDAWWDAAEKENALGETAEALPYHLHFAVREFQARALAAYQLAEEKLAGAERERCARRSRALMAPEKTPLAGGDRGDRFEEAKDVSQARGILVGLRLWLRQVGTGQAVAALQPVFRVPGGEAPGVVRGPREGGDLEAIARQGYAVAGIVAASDGRRLAGLRVVFHRVRGGRLDPRDSYESEWIGGKGVGKEVALGGTGAVAVGIHGLQGAEGATVGALGLVLDAPRSSQ